MDENIIISPELEKIGKAIFKEEYDKIPAKLIPLCVVFGMISLAYGVVYYFFNLVKKN